MYLAATPPLVKGHHAAPCHIVPLDIETENEEARAAVSGSMRARAALARSKDAAHAPFFLDGAQPIFLWEEKSRRVINMD